MLAKLHTARRRRSRRNRAAAAGITPGAFMPKTRFGRAQIVKRGSALVVKRKPRHLYYVDGQGVIHERPLKKGGQRGHVTCYRKGRKVSCKGRRR